MIRAFLITMALNGVILPLAGAQACEPSDTVNAVRIQGTGVQGRLNDHVAPEIYGGHNFEQILPNGWEFILSRAKYGWQIGLYTDGADLTAKTPPRMGPNPREIYGWHFRNRENTGPNTGEVNAPQEMRTFLISPSPKENKSPGATSPSPSNGIGWLKIEDYGLSDLQPGQTARMTYLKFSACVSWPKSDVEIRETADQNSLVFEEVEQEIYGSCGLDLSRFELKANITPRELGGDIDGDGSIDEVAQIMRKADGKRGLALCRAGTWMTEIGYGGAMAPVEDILSGLEVWHRVTDAGDLPRSLRGVTLPDADGDTLVLERVEKQAVAVFWKDGELRSETLFRLVTE